MSKFSERKYNVHKRAERKVLEEVSKRLELALEYKNQGKDVECDQIIDDVSAWLEELIQEPEKSMRTESTTTFDRSVFPQMGGKVAEGKKVILKILTEEEKEEYLNISYTYSFVKGMYETETFREEKWKSFLEETAFVCSIYDKVSSEYIGYCSVKDMAREDWEVAIELKPEFCRQGYGSESLCLLMNAVHRLTGRRHFRARVEIDNHPSQKLMKKLGAKPNGISEFLLHGDDIKEFQMENIGMITDEIREVAVEFGMKAEEIIGYVLEYRFDMETNGCPYFGTTDCCIL